MNENREKEEGVEKWYQCGCASDSTPGETHDPVRNVVLP